MAQRGYELSDKRRTHTLTDEAWTEICKEFDEWDDAGNDVSEWIADAVVEKSELKE